MQLLTGDRRPLTGDRVPQASMLEWAQEVLATAWRAVRSVLAASFRLTEGLVEAVAIVLERNYRRLPGPMRAWINRVVRVQFRILLPRFRYSIAPRIGIYGKWVKLSEISERNARIGLARTRYRSGVAQIFYLPTPAPGNGAAPADMIGSAPPPGGLPSSANEVLNRLLRDMGAGSENWPRS